MNHLERFRAAVRALRPGSVAAVLVSSQGAELSFAGHGVGVIQNEADYDRLKDKLYPPVDDAIELLTEWGKRQREGKLVVWITSARPACTRAKRPCGWNSSGCCR